MAKAIRLTVEIRNTVQMLALLEALAIGALLGLGYDLLRPPRHKSGKTMAVALDLVFCAGAFWTVFCFAMASDNGRLGAWELGFALSGFVVYMYCLSPGVLRIYVPIIGAGLEIARRCKKNIKKCWHSTKFFFKKVRECFIIKK